MTTQTTKPTADDTTVGARGLLAALWISHFLLWTFGDMLTLVQDMSEPITSTAIEFVAVTTALVQASVIILSLMAPRRLAALVNLVAAPVYLLFNIGFFADATQGWEYYLGIGYVAMNLLVFWVALRWYRAS